MEGLRWYPLIYIYHKRVRNIGRVHCTIGLGQGENRSLGRRGGGHIPDGCRDAIHVQHLVEKKVEDSSKYYAYPARLSRLLLQAATPSPWFQFQLGSIC